MGGIYSAFARIGSPKFLISKASPLLKTLYKPAICKTIEKKENSVTVRITKLSEITETLEIHIMGWIERALEICGSKNPRVEITSSQAKGGPYFEFKAVWDQ
ncbi:hypothetical protein ACFLZ9_00485 [Patescibacteria group bacterium]